MRRMIGIRLCGVVADLFVLLVTLRYTRFLRYLRTPGPRSSALEGSCMGTLPRVVGNNGVLYFSMLLLINVISLLLSREYQLIASLGNWIGGLMSILTCRFILDLQEANQFLSGLTTGGEHCLTRLDGSTHLSFRALHDSETEIDPPSHSRGDTYIGVGGMLAETDTDGNAAEPELGRDALVTGPALSFVA
ncbi:hypothetical protein C8Q79DRAFT_53528 [Trametes meyenii]|nr:hypothetical protein C8Q79DRAFT_53528 [Trametes meyenii]